MSVSPSPPSPAPTAKPPPPLLLTLCCAPPAKPPRLIGTIEYQLAGRVLPAVNTTPESLDLFAMFAELERLGGTHVTLEASSHALDLGRIYAMHVHTAGFTNFTRDHLDYHHTMEAYFAAKQLLFKPRSAPPPRFAVLNADDEWVRKIELAPETQAFWYSLKQATSSRFQYHLASARESRNVLQRPSVHRRRRRP